MDHGFTWFSLIPYISESPDRQLVLTTVFVAAILFFLCRSVLSAIKKSSNPLIPKEKITLQNFFEVVIQTTLSILKDIIGPSAEKYLPLIGGLFIFILFCNFVDFIGL